MKQPSLFSLVKKLLDFFQDVVTYLSKKPSFAREQSGRICASQRTEKHSGTEPAAHSTLNAHACDVCIFVTA